MIEKQVSIVLLWCDRLLGGLDAAILFSAGGEVRACCRRPDHDTKGPQVVACGPLLALRHLVEMRGFEPTPRENSGVHNVHKPDTQPSQNQAQNDTPQKVTASVSRPNVSRPEHGLNTPETQEGHEKCADVRAGRALS